MRVAEDYFEVLGLLQTAPHDLVMEAYWDSAHRLQGAASTDPSAQALLVRLNQAYAWLTHPDDEQRANLLPQPSFENGQVAARAERQGWLARLLKRAPNPVQAAPNHWELLHILPSASPDLVKLAYDFWRRQLRGSLGVNADPALERLSHAYQAIVAAASANAAPDQADAGVELPDSSDEVQQQTADVQQQTADEAEPPALGDSLVNLDIDSEEEVVQQQAAGLQQQAANETERVALEDSLINLDVDSEEVEAREENPARRPWALRAWSATVSTGGAAGHRTRRFLSTSRERIGKWAADPFRENDRQVQLELELQLPPEPGAVDLMNRSDKRLRSLASTVGTEAARIDEIGSQAHSALPSDTVKREAEGRSEESTGRDPESRAARLVAENGMSWAIGAEALSVGSDPTCDITVGVGSPDAEHVTARVWARGERVVLHALAPEPPVLVNGQRVTWALLEDGDTLQVCDIMLRFDAYITGEGRKADVAGA